MTFPVRNSTPCFLLDQSTGWPLFSPDDCIDLRLVQAPTRPDGKHQITFKTAISGERGSQRRRRAMMDSATARRRGEYRQRRLESRGQPQPDNLSILLMEVTTAIVTLVRDIPASISSAARAARGSAPRPDGKRQITFKIDDDGQCGSGPADGEDGRSR